MDMLRPPRLRRGDVVGIVSPSWYGPGVGHRVERGMAHLRSLGFAPRLGAHALNSRGWVSDTAEHRVEDIHTMLRDPAVRAIVATIGGDHACQLLPLLDWQLFRADPKILIGFSDITVLNVAVWAMTGLVTFNGPTLMTEWAEYPRMPEYSERAVLKALCDPSSIGELHPADWWTGEFLDWRDQKDLERPRERRPSAGWVWLREGRAAGRLVGGCLESLQHLRGTPYWPNLDGAILFVETSDEAPSVATVDALLMDFENMGVFAQVTGLLVARPYGYSEEARLHLHEVVRERTERFGFPVVADMEFGHTSPMLTLPIGCRAEIDAETRTIRIAEAAVR
jgi:muramoyltetrapeptide carboxypeptidase LdcA involved in peptidoglycan recycling